VTDDHPQPTYAQNLAFLTLLIIIFFERSTFYGMVSIIAIHLKNTHHPNPSTSTGIISASVYGLAFLGGVLGDRVSYRLSALVGSIFALAAYTCLLLGTAFWIWVPLLGLGIGLFKPVIPVMIGKSVEGFPEELSKRQLRFYTLVNVGGFTGPLIVGFLYDPSNPVLALGFIVGCSLLTVLVIMAMYRNLGAVNFRNPIERQVGGRLDLDIIDNQKKQTTSNICKLLLFCSLSICFWAGYHSFYGPVALWFDVSVNRNIAGWKFPTAWIQNINPAIVVFVGVFIPSLFSKWTLSKRIITSLILMFVSFTFLAGLANYYTSNVPLILSAIAIFIASVAELLISPLGLTTVVSLAPPKHVAVFMSIWYLTSAVGGYLSGTLGDTPSTREFLAVAVVSLIAGGVAYAMRTYINPSKKPTHPLDQVPSPVLPAQPE